MTDVPGWVPGAAFVLGVASLPDGYVPPSASLNPPPDRPSAFELWRQAGGGTDDYDADRYIELMREHGLIVPRDHPDAAKSRNLPCGWPHLPEDAGDG